MKNQDENLLIFAKNEKNLRPLAEAKLEAGDTEGALSVYLEIEKTSKFSLSLYREIANLYTALKMYNKSIDYWFKFLNFTSKRHYAEAYNGLGGNFYLAKSFELAAYYFNLQISDDGEEEYPFDDYIYDLFSFANEKDETPPLKLVDVQGEIDKKNIKKAKRLFEKEPNKAYYIIKQVESNSSEYENACLNLAAFYMVDGDYQSAIEKYQEIRSNSQNYDYAVNNTFGAYCCLGDEKGMEQAFMRLKKENCADFEQLVKFFHLLTAIKQEKICCLFSSYLHQIFSTPKLYLYSGVAYYNCGEYQRAKDYFFDYFKLSNDYFARYCLNTCRLQLQGEKDCPSKLSYTFTLPKTEIENLHERASYYLGFSESKVIRYASDLFEFANATLATNESELQIIACQLLSFVGNRKAIKFLKNLLIMQSVDEAVKIAVLSILAEMGNDTLTGFVYGGVYSRLPYEKVEFTEGKGEFFLSAYAIAFGRIAPYDEDELYKLKISAYDIYYKLLKSGNIRKVNDMLALSAYIVINAGLSVKLSAEEMIDYIGSTVEEVNKIIKLTKE